ncbi:MAG: 3-oxoacyl-(acyl-carrier-protein) reductase [uncultured bacterium]|nr:MAG: 3-oxoacyl-(acyl-carrier-protein) reductase [uncultured bacterium]
MRLDGKVVLVVGSGEHLGRSAPLLFAQEGAKVILSARREAVLEETAQMIHSKGGIAAICVGDATNPKDAERMVQTAVEQFGRLDVLYNNIGGGWVELDKKLHEISEDAYTRIIASNLTAVFNICKAGIVQFLKQGNGGCIINVAASEHVRRMANPLYAYTKAGIIEMSKNMANDYLDDRIRVNCLGPGLFAYEPIKDPIVRPHPLAIIRVQPKTARQGIPADMAYAGLFLASDESNFITGQYIAIDGGDDVKLTDLILD